MWVAQSPKSLLDTVWIFIVDFAISRDDPRRVIDLRDKYFGRWVHVDELTQVAADYNKHATRLPTPSSVARAERAKSGVRDIGDDVATMLRACKNLDEVYAAASEYLVAPVDALRAKYQHLNPGQQRMNLGNRMRAKFKKEHV